MDPYVFVAVLAAAAFHAGWNALLKIRLKPIVSISLISIAAGIVAIPFAPMVGLPSPKAWPFVFASLAIHLAYFVALAEAYRFGDLSQVYPLARGTAPLITALGATIWLDEALGIAGWVGLIILATGIIMLSIRGKNFKRVEARPITFALLTAATIAAYTLFDGIGARLGSSPAPYIVWLFVLDGIMMLFFGLWRIGPGLASAISANWQMVLAGGGLSTAAYGIAIWAMTKAPIALVAALRETSVLFAAAIGVVFLREPFLVMRILATVLVVTGIVVLRMR
jgi:drug/metabolite transporter (DMT)-like permease